MQAGPRQGVPEKRQLGPSKRSQRRSAVGQGFQGVPERGVSGRVPRRVRGVPSIPGRFDVCRPVKGVWNLPGQGPLEGVPPDPKKNTQTPQCLQFGVLITKGLRPWSERSQPLPSRLPGGFTLPHRSVEMLGRGPRSKPRAPMHMDSGALGSLGFRV